LPWNQLAYYATKVGTDILGEIPLMGGWLLKLARGGDDVTGATLTRFFGVHVAILPMIVTFVLGLHLALVQKQGMSVPIGKEYQNGKSMPFLPNFAVRDLIGWTVAFGILILLSSLFPWELGVKADPLAPAPAGIRPEWFFCFMFQTLKYIPGHVLFLNGELFGILGFSLGALALVVVPFLDRKAAREERDRWFTIIGWIVIAYMCVFTALAYME
jgi:cytochrome b6